MKKLLLLPTILFPYTVCALLAYCFIWGGFSSDPMTVILGIGCLACLTLAPICNIVYMVLSRRTEPDEILKDSLRIKIMHIPTYILIFLLGSIMFMMIYMTFPFILFLVFLDCVTLFLSNMISVFALAKNIKNSKAPSIIALICQFFFCADVISMFAVNRIEKKRRCVSSTLCA